MEASPSHLPSMIRPYFSAWQTPSLCRCTEQPVRCVGDTPLERVACGGWAELAAISDHIMSAYSGGKMTVESDKAAKQSRRVRGGEVSAEIVSQLNFDVEGQTSGLPSIESAKLSPGGRGDLKELKSGSLLRRNERSRSRRRRGSYRDTTVAAAKMPFLAHTELPTGKFSRRSDDTAIEQELSLERVRAKRSNSASKLCLEPLHRPDVDLKSPVLKLCNLSPVQLNDSVKNVAERPFSCTCRHCGLKFGKHSIAIHERRCHESIKHQSLPRECLSDTTVRNSYITEAPIARIVTIGLGSAQCEHLTVHACLPPRPGTQTLHNSSLRDSGYGLPYIPSASEQPCATNSLRQSPNDTNSDTTRYGMTLCEKCGRVVAAGRISVHSRLCKPDAQHKISTNSVRFPSMCDLLKVERESFKQPGPTTFRKKPPTVVCYICGREYGTKSIAIHEPQCLKKFEMEKRMLPVCKRKPLPKKRLEEKPKLVQLISKEEQIIAINGCLTDNELVQERMDMIFQQCYLDFEHELVPCKRCGRKFAPERHKQHEPKCNAKPLKFHKSKSISSCKSVS